MRGRERERPSHCGAAQGPAPHILEDLDFDPVKTCISLTPDNLAENVHLLPGYSRGLTVSGGASHV